VVVAFLAEVFFVVVAFLAEVFFLGAAAFLALVFSLGAAAFSVLVFFLGAAFFLGAVFFFGAAFFSGVAFFLGAATFLGLEAAFAPFLVSALSLYEFLTWTRSPSTTAFFNAFKNIPFNHFLSAGRSACMCFLMAIEEEPVRSLSSVMAAIIPALYDMVMIALNGKKN